MIGVDSFLWGDYLLQLDQNSLKSPKIGFFLVLDFDREKVTGMVALA
jgi:hypothetical protein